MLVCHIEAALFHQKKCRIIRSASIARDHTSNASTLKTWTFPSSQAVYSLVGFRCHGGSHIDQAQRGRLGVFHSTFQDSLEKTVSRWVLFCLNVVLFYFEKKKTNFSNSRKFWKDKRGGELALSSFFSFNKKVNKNQSGSAKKLKKRGYRFGLNHLYIKLIWKILWYIIICLLRISAISILAACHAFNAIFFANCEGWFFVDRYGNLAFECGWQTCRT